MSESTSRHVLDHVSIQCGDIDASTRFYDAFLTAMGAERVMEYGDGVAYGYHRRPEFWLGGRHTGDGFRETHLAFAAWDRSSVDAACAAVRSLGATVLHEPRLWPEYHPSYYAAFVRDPDGNNVEAVTHVPENAAHDVA